MFYRGKELKNSMKLKDCAFQLSYKDEEGIQQDLAVCILCHTPKIQESMQPKVEGLINNGSINPGVDYSLDNVVPKTFVEFQLLQEKDNSQKNGGAVSNKKGAPKNNKA